MGGGDLLNLLIERDVFEEDFARFYAAEVRLSSLPCLVYVPFPFFRIFAFSVHAFLALVYVSRVSSLLVWLLSCVVFSFIFAFFIRIFTWPVAFSFAWREAFLRVPPLAFAFV